MSLNVTEKSQNNLIKKRRGAPRKQINLELLKNLSAIQCTLGEMAAGLGCHVDTLRDNYSAIIEEGRENGRKSLRRIQFELAKRSAAMAIFLGKQYLGQKDESYNTPTYSKITVERNA